MYILNDDCWPSIIQRRRCERELAKDGLRKFAGAVKPRKHSPKSFLRDKVFFGFMTVQFLDLVVGYLLNYFMILKVSWLRYFWSSKQCWRLLFLHLQTVQFLVNFCDNSLPQVPNYCCKLIVLFGLGWDFVPSHSARLEGSRLWTIAVAIVFQKFK